MRVVPAEMTERWKAQAKTGAARPVVRATIQIANLRKFEYDTFYAEGGDFDKDRHRRGIFSSIVMGDPSLIREIPQIKNYTWTRSLDQDVATCSLTLKNVVVTPIGNQEEMNQADDFDLPGYFTYNRGDQKISQDRWDYSTETGWHNVFVPDRLVKTYEGYSWDPNVAPALDPNLVQSGTWLIDKVTYTADGDITLEMRDIGRLLLDQIVFPPVVPFSEYPLTWSRIASREVPGRDCKGGSWVAPPRGSSAQSSNQFYIGLGLENPPFDSYVQANGGVNGHVASDALVNKDGPEYWLSTGQTTVRSKVWWQVDFPKAIPLAGLRIHPHGGPYRVYISIKTDKGWLGRKKVPYEVTTEGVNVHAGIPFVETMIADKQNPYDVVLRRKYANVKAVRLTFSNLQYHQLGVYPYHAALRDILIYTAPSVDDLHFERGTVLKVVGNYRDWTDVVKWVCAWGGFFWPPHSTDADYMQLYSPPPDHSAGRLYLTYETRDPVLPKGRVWGDFMQAGTGGIADLGVEMFDKKPLMDIVNYVRDLLGFVFWIDETGGVVWRMPNLGLAGNPKKGNYLSPGHLKQRTRRRTDKIITIDEEETLLTYQTTLSSENIRERIFVSNVTGKIGTCIKGFIPFPVGFRRTAGWTDQNFETKREVRVMADMLAARSMFEYRRSQLTIPGYPAIQMDDQIRVLERTTNETYYHYVLGITSTLDMEEGNWEYQLNTHWLGESPSDAWVVKIEQLDKLTQSYLNLLD